MSHAPTLFVVDDDPAILEAMRAVGGYLGLAAETYDSAERFLDKYDGSREGCLILDVKMPGMDGLALQRVLAQRDCFLPIIMLSGQGDVPTAVHAMQQGAVTFMEKPFALAQMSGQIMEALQTARQRKGQWQRRKDARERLSRLTQPQREVFDLLTQGQTNQQIAERLGLSLRAIEDRKARLIQALEADSLAELFTLASLAGEN